MNKILRIIIPLIFIIGASLVMYFVSHHSITLFDPKGMIAQKESWLITTFILLMISVGIPSVLLTFFTAWRFRSTNPKATYSPDGKQSLLTEIIWWLIPSAIIAILATLMWQNTHALDPHIAFKSTQKPMTIQVVSLQWKWLFIYPKEQIATVNFVEFPAGTPITFALTADSPFNSFWIPSLGGQLYTMTGMVNNLHLIANHPGEYQGSTAEISGKGFAGMRFVAKATSQKDFNDWVTTVKKSNNTLDWNAYTKLAQPSEDMPVTLYSIVDTDLYNKIVTKYDKPKIRIRE